MVSMEEINVKKIIREVFASSGEVPSREEVTKTVIAQLSVEQYLEALTQALPALIREVQQDTRVPLPKDLTLKKSEPVTTQTKKTKQAHIKGRFAKRVHEDWTTTLLNAQYATPSGMKKLAQCTYTDLKFIGDNLIKQGQQSIAKGKKFLSLAEQMREQGAEQAKDIQVATLQQFVLN